MVPLKISLKLELIHTISGFFLFLNFEFIRLEKCLNIMQSEPKFRISKYTYINNCRVYYRRFLSN